jgi:hypothetical protein
MAANFTPGCQTVQRQYFPPAPVACATTMRNILFLREVCACIAPQQKRQTAGPRGQADMAPQTRIERATCPLGGGCSIH